MVGATNIQAERAESGCDPQAVFSHRTLLFCVPCAANASGVSGRHGREFTLGSSTERNALYALYTYPQMSVPLTSIGSLLPWLFLNIVVSVPSQREAKLSEVIK